MQRRRQKIFQEGREATEKGTKNNTIKALSVPCMTIQGAPGGGKGSSVTDVRTFGLKKLRILEIYSVYARTKGEGIEPVRTRRERGSSFRDVVRTPFTDGPFWVCSNISFSNAIRDNEKSYLSNRPFKCSYV